MLRFKKSDKAIIMPGLFTLPHVENVYDEYDIWALKPNGTLTNGKKFIEKGQYTIVGEQLPHCAWIGGYPIVYETSDSEFICADCATDHEMVVDSHAYYEGRHNCDHCHEEIVGAYEDQA